MPVHTRNRHVAWLIAAQEGRREEEERKEELLVMSNGQHTVPAQCAGANKLFGCAGTKMRTLTSHVPAHFMC